MENLGLDVNVIDGKIKSVTLDNKRFRNFAKKKQAGNTSANLEIKTDNVTWSDIDNNRGNFNVKDNYGNTGLDLPKK
ncbi:hypothetical protein [Flavobacterium sp.]|uniref:hypothetical protein n=1 Tax=Flavobacterium sp. TaxID=239 RepID=UPI0040476605